MRRMACIVVLALAAAGCAGPDQAFVLAVEKTWEAVRPQYVGYLERDPDLSADDREGFLRTVKKFDELLELARDP